MSEELELKINSKIAIKKIEKEIFIEGTVIQENAEKIFKYENLLLEEKAAIDEFCAKFNFSDSSQVSKFGDIAYNKAKTNFYKVSQKIKDIEKIIKVLTDLVLQIEEFNTSLPVTLNPRGIKSIFFNIEKQTEKIIVKFSEIELNISKLEKQLESQKIKLLKNITLIDSIYKEIFKCFKELSLYIIIGEKSLKELKTKILPELRKDAKKNKYQNNIKVTNETISRLERKVLKLKNTRMILIQIAAKIKVIENDDSELVSQIKKLLDEISLWKNKSIVALGVSNTPKKSKQSSQKDEIIETTDNSKVDLTILQQENKLILEHFNKILKNFQDENEKRIKVKQEIVEFEKTL